MGCCNCLNGRINSAQLFSLIAGWWGIPFGIILTPVVLITNELNRINIKTSDRILRQIVIDELKSELII